jgi:uncharacterized membrane protein
MVAKIKVELSDAAKAAKAAADAAKDKASDTAALLWALESFLLSQLTSFCEIEQKIVAFCLSAMSWPVCHSFILR